MIFYSIIDNFAAWLAIKYAEIPIIIIGIGMASAVPFLAVACWLIRYVIPNMSKRVASVPRFVPTSVWKARGQLVIADGGGESHEIDYGLLQIGREADNDIRLMYDNVHRYHAILERTSDAKFYILDVSGRDGNGVRVDGGKIQHARLRGGELIQIGPVCLHFQLVHSV